MLKLLLFLTDFGWVVKRAGRRVDVDVRLWGRKKKKKKTFSFYIYLFVLFLYSLSLCAYVVGG